MPFLMEMFWDFFFGFFFWIFFLDFFLDFFFWKKKHPENDNNAIVIQISVLQFQNNIPVFTMPMTLVTLVMITVSDTRGLLYRVEDMSYPEKQAYDWHTRIKVKQHVSIFFINIFWSRPNSSPKILYNFLKNFLN
jgi:hypothetical protein